MRTMRTRKLTAPSFCIFFGSAAEKVPTTGRLNTWIPPVDGSRVSCDEASERVKSYPSPRKSPAPAQRALSEPPTGIAPEPPPKPDPNAIGFHAHDVALWHWKFRQEGVADNPAAANRHFWAWAGQLEPLAGRQGQDNDPGSVRKRLRRCWPWRINR
jgi:hypothetical protein